MTDISGINPVSDGSTRHYTPTTEEVREVYQCRLIKVGDNRFQLIDQVEADAEFDRWLAEVKAQAWEEGCSWGVSNFHILKASYKTNPNREEK